MEDSKLETGKYVTGLSANEGALIFDNVSVDEDGEYILTLGLRKAGLYNKYAQILVNEKDSYETYIPQPGFTHEGRHQIKIRLNKGENSIKIFNPVASRFDSAVIQYTNMGKQLKRAANTPKRPTAEKPIVYLSARGRKPPVEVGRRSRQPVENHNGHQGLLGFYPCNLRV